MANETTLTGWNDASFAAWIADQILDAVSGKATTKKRVLRELIEQKILVQAGAGTKGEPYTYMYKRIPVAPPISD